MSEPELDYQPARTPTHGRFGTSLAIAAVASGAAATLLPLLSLVPMFTVPAGSTIRPMGQASAIFLGVAAGICLVAPLALTSAALLRRARQSRRWAVLAMLAMVASIFLCPTIFVLAIKCRGLVLAD